MKFLIPLSFPRNCADIVPLPLAWRITVQRSLRSSGPFPPLAFWLTFSAWMLVRFFLHQDILMLVVLSHFFLGMEELLICRFKSLYIMQIFSIISWHTFLFHFCSLLLRASIKCILDFLCLFLVVITIICSFLVCFVRFLQACPQCSWSFLVRFILFWFLNISTWVS